jgi:hypothetical protein
VRRRLGSLGGFFKLLPAALGERRRIRGAANVGDAAIQARLVRR